MKNKTKIEECSEEIGMMEARKEVLLATIRHENIKNLKDKIELNDLDEED